MLFKKLKWAVLGAVTAVAMQAAPALAQSNKPFEGTIKMTMKFEGAAIDESMLESMPFPKGFTYQVKNDQVRVTLNGGNLPFKDMLILDKDKKKSIYALDHVRKKAMEMDVPSEEKAKEMAKSTKIEKTTETKVINGYKCVLYKSNATDASTGMEAKMEIWASKDVNFKRPSTSGADAVYDQIEGFPILTVTDMGVIKMTMETTEVKAGPVAADLFELPKGYTKEKFNPASMMKAPGGKTLD